MQNQTSSNNENKVVCRKCGGAHFTIKCGKEKKIEEPITTNLLINNEKSVDLIELNNESSNKSFYKNNNKDDRNDKFNKSNRNDKNDRFEKRPYFKVTYRVKITDLPTDIYEEEMILLLCDWGHIVKVRVINYPESSTAYIDFGYEEEANYFISAIDKTPFEYTLLSACIVDSTRPERSDKFERPERPERFERTNRSIRVEKSIIE